MERKFISSSSFSQQNVENEHREFLFFEVLRLVGLSHTLGPVPQPKPGDGKNQ